MKACSHSEDEATRRPVRFGAPARLRYNPPHDGPRGAEAGGDGLSLTRLTDRGRDLAIVDPGCAKVASDTADDAPSERAYGTAKE